MRYTLTDELTVPASELPAYIGWTLNAATRTDGILAWGTLSAAHVTETGDLVSIVHPVQYRGQSVPEGALIRTTDPMGRPHMVTLSRAREVDAETFARETGHAA